MATAHHLPLSDVHPPPRPPGLGSGVLLSRLSNCNLLFSGLCDESVYWKGEVRRAEMGEYGGRVGATLTRRGTTEALSSNSPRGQVSTCILSSPDPQLKGFGLSTTLPTPAGTLIQSML